MAEIVTMGELLCEIMRPAENVDRILPGSLPQRSTGNLHQHSSETWLLCRHHRRSRQG